MLHSEDRRFLDEWDEVAADVDLRVDIELLVPGCEQRDRALLGGDEQLPAVVEVDEPGNKLLL